MAEVFGIISGALQTSQQVIQLAIKIRDYRRSPENLKHSAGIVVNASRNFYSVADFVYEALLEAEVNPNFEVHPDLEKTFEQANAALQTSGDLVKMWAKRIGIELLWEETDAPVRAAPTSLPKETRCSPDGNRVPSRPKYPIHPDARPNPFAPIPLASPTDSDTDTPFIDKRRSSICRNPYARVKSNWYQWRFVAYGGKEIEKAVDLLLHERSQLTILTNTLSFQISKRLKKVEKIIINAWKELASKTNPAPKLAQGGQNFEELSLSCSYDTYWRRPRGGSTSWQIFVNRKLNDEPLMSLDWIVKMLGAIPEASIREVGLLHCAGYATPDSKSESVNALVFDPPEGCSNITPRTLRDLLNQRSDPPPSLTERIRAAQTLVASVVVLHSLGIVHRYLTPEGIVLFKSDGDPRSLGDLYLLGFGQSRPETGGSGDTKTDDTLRAKLYMHPDILTVPRKRKFEMKHDIFSLGVCLLEIALWEPFFVPYRHASKRFQDLESRKSLTPDAIIFDKYGPYSGIDDEHLRLRMMESPKDSMWRTDIRPGSYDIALERRDVLVEIAKSRLPPLVGQIFCDVIVTCLEIDKRQLSNMVVIRDWVYATEETREGPPTEDLDYLPTKVDMSTQTEDDDTKSPSTEVVHATDASIGIVSAVGLKGDPDIIPSSSSSGRSTPDSADSKRTSITLCDSELLVEQNTISPIPPISTQSPSTELARVDASWNDAQLSNLPQQMEKGEPQVGGFAGGQDEQENLDKVMMKLLKEKELSGSSWCTVIIARNILKKLERVNL